MALKFKIDENLPAEISEMLNSAGKESSTVLEQGLRGESDVNISRLCLEGKKILVTLDNDFGNIKMYPPALHSGIIVLKLRKQDKRSVIKLFEKVIKTLEAESPDKKLWIVEENRIRIRE